MIRLVPMTSAEFDRYRAGAVESYAAAHIKAGDCEPQDALALAEADYASLLPHGLASPGQHLFSIRTDASAEPIGMIWFEAREKRGRKSAFVYDFVIERPWRRKGYGEATLRALEGLVASMDVARISLNVMGWNHGAKALYDKAGFAVTGIGMTKAIDH